MEEARVETLCVGKDVARKAVAALKKYVQYLPSIFVLLLISSLRAYPYEEPSYGVYKLENF